MENREIKFRGKRVKDGKWKYGFLGFNPIEGQFYIHEVEDIPPTYANPGGDVHSERYDIKPETIGEYIGRKDKNDIEIFTGDRLKIVAHIVTKGNGEKIYNEHLATAVWSAQDYGFRIKYDDHVIQGKDFLCEIKMLESAEIKIISNIHEKESL